MSLNKVILIGRLGKDPETRYMPNGNAVTNFTLATSETWNEKGSGDKVERTEWHNITMFGRVAEVAGQYLKKGSQVYLEGKIKSEKYTGRDGIERTAYKIECREMTMLGSKNGSYSGESSSAWDDDEDYRDDGYANDETEAEEVAPRKKVVKKATKKTTSKSSEAPAAPKKRTKSVDAAQPVEDIDSDIPF